MTKATDDWPQEWRPVPAGLAAEAAANPGGSIAEIDGSMVSDANGYVPPEAIIGAFLVGPDGVARGEYVRNPGHGPVRDDYDKLELPGHWLEWLPGRPRDAVRNAIEEILTAQVAGAQLEWLKIIDDPVFLTGGVPRHDEPARITVRRAALAVPFALSVLSGPTRRDIVTGSFSWVAVNLDQPDMRRDRTWFDIGATRDQAEAMLQSRIFEVDTRP